MGALEGTLGVWCIESKNVEKALVFKAFLKISCKEFSHFEKKKKVTFLIKNDFFTKYGSFGSYFGRMMHY